MKTNTKIWLLIFIASLVASFFTTTYLFSAISLIPSGIVIKMTTLAWVALIIVAINTVAGNVLFFKFLKALKFNSMLFFSTVPLTLTFAGVAYVLATINTYNNTTVTLVRTVLQINSNNYNNYYWIAVILLIYLTILFITFTLVSAPIKRIEKATTRLAYGGTKSKISIGGGKQFKEIENSLNKINDSAKQKEVFVTHTNVEYEKAIPKAFLKYLGKNSTAELEIGSRIQREVTTLFCGIRNTSTTAAALSLEENYNYINSYINIVAPIIKKHSGFVDKYVGDGVLAVFVKAESAFACAHAIIKAIHQKNAIQTSMPNLEVGVALHTGNIDFCIEGHHHKKYPTICPDSTITAVKMEDINKVYGSCLIFSKSTLNALSSTFSVSYRYIGSLADKDQKQIFAIFESLEVYAKQKRDKLEKFKFSFEDGVRAYHNAKYEHAKQIFEKVYKQEKDDKICYVYYNKCCEAISGGPIRR